LSDGILASRIVLRDAPLPGSEMNWLLIGSLSLLGIAMGVLSVLGHDHFGVAGALWFCIAIACALVIARRAPSRPFLHGFAVGVLDGLEHVIAYAGFHATDLADDPDAARGVAQPGERYPRLLILIFSVVIGLSYGLVLGGLAWQARRMLAGRKPGPG